MKEERRLEYWISQPVDLYLVIRQTEETGGETIRWRNVTRYLKDRRDKASRQIVCARRRSGRACGLAGAGWFDPREAGDATVGRRAEARPQGGSHVPRTLSLNQVTGDKIAGATWHR